jgi:hypothetical protein
MEKNLRCQATKDANLVLGQTDFTSNLSPTPPNATSLANPTSVVVDPLTRKIFVSDRTNIDVEWKRIEELRGASFPRRSDLRIACPCGDN